MSMHIAKAALRQAKNITKGFSDIQVKVREATSNDPWGPSGSQMAELADASYNAHEFMEIMDMIDKRLNDSGKNWRHVFKALTVLDYLIHSGSEQVVAYAKQNLYVIKTLKEFQFIDEDGRDQGLNVRERSKAIANLLSDEERLKEERKARSALRDRMAASGTGGATGSNVYGAGSQGPNTTAEEQRQLERAIEESKRSAAEHERRVKEREREERELQRAIEQTKQESQVVAAKPKNDIVDLWGAPTDQKKDDLDFFSSMAAPAAAQTTRPDPFGMGAVAAPVASNNIFAASQSAAFSAMGGFASTGFAAPAPLQQQSSFGGSPALFAASTPSFAAASPAFGAQAVAQSPAFGGFSSAAPVPATSNAGFNASFDSAFNTGSVQKSLVPQYVQSQTNPNAQLAQIARNSSQIDPFASLATSSNANKTASAKGSMNDLSGAFGSSTNPWSSSASAVPNYSGNFTTTSASANPFSKPAAPANDPFASLVPLSKSAISAPASAPVNKPMNSQNSFAFPPSGGFGTANNGANSFAPAPQQNNLFGAPSQPVQPTNNQNFFF